MSLISALVIVLGALVRPTAACCPTGRDLRTGIRRSGAFACWSTPRGDPEWDGTFGRPDRSVQADDAIEGRIYCGVGAPVVVDSRTVRCRGSM